jgi:hypothetical protein
VSFGPPVIVPRLAQLKNIAKIIVSMKIDFLINICRI